MLPSTGYFKGINCPFYDSGLCERPYCHFRHVKKEPNVVSDGIESGAILQKLVSAAVQKVLQQKETTTSTLTITTAATTPVTEETNAVSGALPSSKVTYNPTPISELNKITSVDGEAVTEDTTELRKRHIPVPYTPRKPATIPLNKPIDSNGASKPFIYIPPPVKYLPGSSETPQIDAYTPKGTVESKEKYLPGAQKELQEYTPKETELPSPNKHNYIPSDKSVSKRKILEYKPIKVTTKSAAPSVTYQPTPRSQVPCFSSDEDEPDTKKTKLTSDLNGLDDLGPEFDILDQILDEEKPVQTSGVDDKEKEKENVEKSKDKIERKPNEHSTKNKNEHRKSGKRSHDKTKSDRKEKSSSHEKEKSNKTKSSDKTSKKSSSKDRSRDHSKSKSDRKKDERKDKSSKDKKHSDSKSSNDRSKESKHSKRHTSKDSDRNSKYSSSSKSKDKHSNHKSHRSSKDSKDRHKKKNEESNHSPENDNHFEDDINLELDEDLLSDSDEETRALECKRIFEEYVPMEKSKIDDEIENKTEDNHDHDEYISSKKRISRTTDKKIKIIPRAPIKPDYKVSAAQAMAERLQKVREYHASKQPIIVNNEITKVESNKSNMNISNAGNSKIRIAHVPYVSTMLNAKKTIQPNIKSVKSEPSTSSTIIQTIKKGAQRVAHVPNDKFIDRPGVLEPLASKIPANIRSTYLNMMIDECIKIYLTAVDAYARAQHEELTTSKKCSTVQIYKNSAVLTVSRLRKELQECKGVKKSGTDCSTLQKIPQTIAGKTNNTGSWSIENKNKKFVDNKEFSGAKLYNNIKKWVLTEEQLQQNGFPRPHPSREKGRAMIYSQNKQKPPKGFIRTCCRCKKEYTVDKKGFPAVREECIYHPNNKYRVRGEARYQCCSQDSTSDGCCIAPTHVYEFVDYENLRGYVTTMSPERTMDDYGVYSLDCEMCYTTQGLDLTRVTVINSDCKVIYETLVRPLHPITDYNTRYSGITEEQMLQVKTTLLEVQATLLAMFNSKTILIGHSLESDFKALKIIHETVIDTSVLFPHKMGLPYKRALRNLSSDHLKKIIQNSVDGHDSAEDATVCMELLHYKLREDLKTR